MTHRIAKRFTFDAAHHLDGLAPGHKCSRPHGHTYAVEVVVAAEELIPPGFVVDFAELSAVGGFINRHLDHTDLSQDWRRVAAREPTSENLAEWLYQWAEENLTLPGAARLEAVRVSETPSTWAEYRL